MYCKLSRLIYTERSLEVYRCKWLSKRRVKRKRSKTIVLMLLPALIFIGFFGWLISALEQSDRAIKPYQAPKAVRRRDDGVTFLPAAYGEQAEVIIN
jgi:hypothetical protein